MLNITGKFVTVFDPVMRYDKSEHVVYANLSSSKKNTKGGNITYENMTWRSVRFVGEAFEPAKALRSKDKIDIIRGVIENHYNKEKKQLYTDVTIFEFVMSDLTKDKGNSAEIPIDLMTV